jgi:hypothetical protein
MHRTFRHSKIIPSNSFSLLKKIEISKFQLAIRIEVSFISHFGISRITLQLYHTKIKIIES